jgi:antitoxin (DNA-binding transcriptional repressor) of toxin-antitoxin stability system
MKTISIRQLHARTGKWVRHAAEQGQVLVSDRGRAVVRMAPEIPPSAVPYFARRRFISQKMKQWIETGQLGRSGTDVTAGISDDREDLRELPRKAVRQRVQAVQARHGSPGNREHGCAARHQCECPQGDALENRRNRVHAKTPTPKSNRAQR